MIKPQLTINAWGQGVTPGLKQEYTTAREIRQKIFSSRFRMRTPKTGGQLAVCPEAVSPPVVLEIAGRCAHQGHHHHRYDGRHNFRYCVTCQSRQKHSPLRRTLILNSSTPTSPRPPHCHIRGKKEQISVRNLRNRFCSAFYFIKCAVPSPVWGIKGREAHRSCSDVFWGDLFRLSDLYLFRLGMFSHAKRNPHKTR